MHISFLNIIVPSIMSIQSILSIDAKSDINWLSGNEMQNSNRRSRRNLSLSLPKNNLFVHAQVFLELVIRNKSLSHCTIWNDPVLSCPS